MIKFCLSCAESFGFSVCNFYMFFQDALLDKSDDFCDFRNRAADLACDMVYIVGSTACFVHLFSLLSNNEAMATWDVTEATLFVMKGIAKHVDK